MKNYCHLIISIFTILLATHNSQAQVAVGDSLALVNLYATNNGANWSNPWQLGQPINTWAGVQVQGNRVRGLNLNGRGLQGQIANLNTLTELRTLLLANNQLFGSVAGITGLANLQELSLAGNDYENEIPVALTAISTLRTLNLAANDFTGEIGVV